jgi:hypothetical protein
MALLGNSAAKAAQKMAAAHPVRPGFERLMCYGTIINQDSSQTSLYSTGRSSDEVRAVLAQQWDVTNTASAVGVLSWLRDGGQRAANNQYVRAVLWQGPPEAQNTSYGKKMFSAYKYAFSAKARQEAEVAMASRPDFILTFEREVPNHATITNNIAAIRHLMTWGGWKKQIPLETFLSLDGIDAWDFERIGNVVRLSFEAGYLTEDDAYSWLYVADTLTRSRYTSWVQYAAAWLLGRAFWSTDPQEFRMEESDNCVALVGSAFMPNNGNQAWLHYPLG